MVVGAPTQQYAVQAFYWQLYEVTGLSLGNVGYILHHALVRLRKAAKVGGE